MSNARSTSRSSTPTTTCTRPQDALTKFLPDRYKGAIDYVDVRGRTKIVVRGQISEYIPNPTFDVVARPGAQEDYFRIGNPEGKSRREIFGEPMRAIPAFREPAARVELMDEQGIDRALMFPTLASLIEERMRDDPELIHAVIHALNEWIHETWQFDYEGRIFTTPVITLPIVEKAIEELEWVVERGARVVLIRPAPVPGYRGSRSFGLPEFDPFWEKVVEHDVLVAMHSSDSGYERYANDWMGSDSEMLPFQPQAFRMLSAWRPIEDAVVGAGLPRRALPVPAAQGGGDRERQQLGRAAAQEPGRRLQEDAAGLPRGPGRRSSSATSTSARSGRRTSARWPSSSASTTCCSAPTSRTPRAWPTRPATSTSSPGLPDETVRKIMGGNLARLMNVEDAVLR